MRIAVDLDGTLAGTHSVFLQELEKEKGISYKLEDLKSWNFENVDFSVDQFTEIATENWKNREIPLTNEKIPEHLKQIYEKHTVDVVTARDDVPQADLTRWLIQKKVPFNDFRVDKEKTHLNYDLLIDDSPKYIGNGMEILLYNRPYNQEVKLRDEDRRVKNFREIRRHIEKIADEK